MTQWAAVYCKYTIHIRAKIIHLSQVHSSFSKMPKIEALTLFLSCFLVCFSLSPFSVIVDSFLLVILTRHWWWDRPLLQQMTRKQTHGSLLHQTWQVLTLPQWFTYLVFLSCFPVQISKLNQDTLTGEAKRNSSAKNEHLLKMCSPSGHPRCRWVCFFIRFGEM